MSNQVPNPFPAGPPQTAQKSSAEGVRTGVKTGEPRQPDKKDELRLLVNSHHPLITIESAEEERVEALLRDVAAELGVAFYVWTVTTGLARYGGQPLYNSSEPELALANIAQVKGDALFLLKDFSRYTEQDKICRKLRDLAEGFRAARRSIVISGASLHLPAELAADAAPYRMALPDSEELLPAVREVLAAAAREQNLAVHLDSQAVAQLTHSLVGLPREEAMRTLRMCLLARGQADPGLLVDVLEAKRKALREDGLLETVRRDSSFGDVAGMARLREWVRKRGSALTPEGRAFGLEAPKGVLITGVQGCGKSLAARAIAGEWGYELARLDAGSLYDKYIGESEKHLHQTLELAQRMAPMVLWIDEIEKAFASSSAGTESDGGLSQRLLATMLTWMQEREGGVFLAATSNNISSLPPEMLRKGRFDEIFFVDLPGEPAREALFGLHLKKRGRDAGQFNLAALAGASEGFSGAEIEQSIVAGLYTAFSGKQQLSTEILLAELHGTQPLSVTRAEEVSSLRAWAQSRAVPAE